jgi:hypothetical protein
MNPPAVSGTVHGCRRPRISDGHLHLRRAERPLRSDALPPQARGLSVEVVVDPDGDVVDARALAGWQALARSSKRRSSTRPAPTEKNAPTALVDPGIVRLAQPEDLTGEDASRLEIVHEDSDMVETHGGQDATETTRGRLRHLGRARAVGHVAVAARL